LLSSQKHTPFRQAQKRCFWGFQKTTAIVLTEKRGRRNDGFLGPIPLAINALRRKSTARPSERNPRCHMNETNFFAPQPIDGVNLTECFQKMLPKNTSKCAFFQKKRTKNLP